MHFLEVHIFHLTPPHFFSNGLITSSKKRNLKIIKAENFFIGRRMFQMSLIN